MVIAGAVFADHFLSERLTNTVFMGPTRCCSGEPSVLSAAVYNVAKTFKILKSCFDNLEHYYETLELPTVANDSLDFRTFPFWNEFVVEGITYTLTYEGRLARDYPEKAVFKAQMSWTDGEGAHNQCVVVKFTGAYGTDAHRLLAQHDPPFAPKLYFCERVEQVGNLFVVVMDYIEWRIKGALEPDAWRSVQDAVNVLHENDFVFGDLRGPNVVQGTQGVMLVDFDWCQKVGVARYPSDINLDLGSPFIKWHAGVRRGGLIEKVHDRYMLLRLGTW